jgi:hypothetical protein
VTPSAWVSRKPVPRASAACTESISAKQVTVSNQLRMRLILSTKKTCKGESGRDECVVPSALGDSSTLFTPRAQVKLSLSLRRRYAFTFCRTMLACRILRRRKRCTRCHCTGGLQALTTHVTQTPPNKTTILRSLHLFEAYDLTFSAIPRCIRRRRASGGTLA